MTSNQKLLAGVLLAPLVGALLYLFTAGGADPRGEAVPEAPTEDEPAPLAELRTPDFADPDDPKAAAFMEARWGHLGEAGAAAPQMDPTGDMYFVVPRIFRGRDSDGRPVYARAIAKPRRLGDVVRASQVTKMSPSQVPLREWDYERVLQLQSALGPIDDPNELPPDLQKEHPLHPDYNGPMGSK